MSNLDKTYKRLPREEFSTPDGIPNAQQQAVTRELMCPRGSKPTCPIMEATGEHPFQPTGMN